MTCNVRSSRLAHFKVVTCETKQNFGFENCELFEIERTDDLFHLNVLYGISFDDLKNTFLLNNEHLPKL